MPCCIIKNLGIIIVLKSILKNTSNLTANNLFNVSLRIALLWSAAKILTVNQE